MSNKESYTSDEWSLLRSTPTFISAGVAAADPGGIIGALKEATAGARAFAEYGTKHADSEFFAALAGDRSFPAMPDPQSLMGQGDAATQATNFQHAVLQRAKDALGVVAHKGTQRDVAVYRDLLEAVAESVANASAEGGFLGFGGVRVSAKEESFLSALATALDEAAGAAPSPVSAESAAPGLPVPPPSG
jgi:hypothetical protein